MKIITLIENHTDNQLKCEHGLSFYIEYNKKAYLLDAGQSALFSENAKALGISLQRVDKAFLSHGHYDHAGGFAAFVRENSGAAIYMQKACAQDCFCQKADGLKNIGIAQEVRPVLDGRVIYVEDNQQVEEGVYLVRHHGENLSERGRQMQMFRETAGEMKYDDFSHEQSLVFDTKNGLVVFNSCCHGGVDAILEEISETFGGRKILAMFGGFHLMGTEGPDSMRESREQVTLLAQKLACLNVDAWYTGHCTGTKAFPILKEVLGDKLHLLVTGTEIEIF